MTNKEFFIKVINAEAPIFEKVVKALPEDKLDFKVHEKARTAGRIAFQLASQPSFIAAIAMEGEPDWGTYREPSNPNLEEILALMKKNFADLKKKLAKVSDEEWDDAEAVLKFPGGEWKTKKYDMAWGFLFDAIHHRGQLSTYLRAMGAKVPSIYGGSADEKPSV
jgi:uncharacterized damage-inducible protein DinB